LLHAQANEALAWISDTFLDEPGYIGHNIFYAKGNLMHVRLPKGVKMWASADDRRRGDLSLLKDSACICRFTPGPAFKTLIEKRDRNTADVSNVEQA
jgi:hypothetical protein